MASTLKNGGIFANDSLLGTIAWVNPSNAQLSDDSKVTSVLLITEITNLLKATNFAFNIPIHSKIDGIVVEIEKSGSALSTIRDSTIKLILPSGSLSSANKATVDDWSTSDAYSTYGTSTDMWSETLTPIDVNDINFGVAMSAVAAVAGTSQVDHIRMTVHYTQLAMPHNMGKVLRVGSGQSRSESAS